MSTRPAAMVETGFHLLCLAAAPHLSAAAEAQLRSLATDPATVWPRIAEGAVRHRCVGLALHGLRRAGISDVPAALRRAAAANAENALRQTAEVVRLSRAFAQADIRCLVLKGVPLSLSLYGDIARRGVGDIDLLVAPSDFARADALLTADGYRRSVHRPGDAEWAAFRDLTYFHPERRSDVELHQRLTSNPRRLPTDFDRLWSEHATVTIGGTPVPVLPTRALPLYLCVHGAAHGWERVCWVADIAALLAEPAARQAALADAAAVGLGRTMRRTLALADTLFASTAHADSAHPDSIWVARFVRRFYAGSRWFAFPLRGTWGWLYFETMRRLEIYAMKDGWGHVRDEIVSDLANPVDHAVLTLPPWLHWSYPLLRPIGWIIRNFTSRRRKL